MKLKKSTKTYCKFCRRHTLHSMTQAKSAGKRGTLKKGSIARAKKRGLGSGFGNLGRYSRPTNPKMSGKKTSKVINLKITCKECNKSQMKTLKRAKRVIFEQ